MSSLSLASTPRKLGKNRITRIIFKEKKCIQDLNNVFKFIRVWNWGAVWFRQVQRSTAVREPPWSQWRHFLQHQESFKCKIINLTKSSSKCHNIRENGFLSENITTGQSKLISKLWSLWLFGLTDCDMIRSSTSWEVAEEAKGNWLANGLVCTISSVISPVTSSGIEEASVQVELLADLLEAMQERDFETSRAETLHDLDKNSIGSFGLSGSGILLQTGL